MRAVRPLALRFAPAALLALTAGAVEAPRDAMAQEQARPGLRFEVSFAPDLHDGPLTGRLMLQRTIEGQPVGSVRQLSRLERAQGSRGRSAGSSTRGTRPGDRPARTATRGGSGTWRPA